MFTALPVLLMGGLGRALAGADCSQLVVGAGEARMEDELEPPIRAAMAEAEFWLDEERGGNIGPSAAVPHPAFLPTAEREDCAVEDLSLRTLLMPTEWPRIEAVVAGPPEGPGTGPGREG